MSRRRVLFAAPLLALVLTGCGSVLEEGTVEDGAADALEAQVGIRPDVDCPADLDAEVGASAECTLTVADDPAEYPVTVTVTSVEGGTAAFDVEVGDAPVG